MPHPNDGADDGLLSCKAHILAAEMFQQLVVIRNLPRAYVEVEALREFEPADAFLQLLEARRGGDGCNAGG